MHEPQAKSTKLGFEEMIQILTKAGYEIQDYFRHRRIDSSCCCFRITLHGKYFWLVGSLVGSTKKYIQHAKLVLIQTSFFEP